MKKFGMLSAVAAIGLAAFSTVAMAADCPIKIGGIAPLSAPGTVVGGEAMRDAMLLAEADLNKQIGCR